jgi:tripartite-type tricarboxylate transporter receptor subunit TctC
MAIVVLATYAGACAVASTALAAERFPERPVRMVIPYAPGGTTDLVGRVAGRELSNAWGQPVVIDNRLGAGGNIATEMVAKAPADGHTLLLNTAAIVIAPSVYKGLGFDPIRDFIPISKLGFAPAVVLVNPRYGINSITDLITMARAQPGKLNFGSSGTGASIHLATERFKTMAKVNMVHVPYKGSSPALADLMGGQIQLLFDGIGTALPLSKAGRLKALAVTTTQRSPFAPELPTVAESGLPGYEFSFWYGLFVPSATPQARVARLHRDIVKVVDAPATKDQLAIHGVTAASSTLADYAVEVKNDLRIWADVARAAGIKPE